MIYSNCFVNHCSLLQYFEYISQMSPCKDLELLLCESLANLLKLPDHPVVAHDICVIVKEHLSPLSLH